MDAVDLQADVFDIAFTRFNVAKSPTITAHVADARRWVQHTAIARVESLMWLSAQRQQRVCRQIRCRGAGGRAGGRSCLTRNSAGRLRRTPLFLVNS
eukprot:237122-Hanusia_phi.AAC.1